MKGKGKAKVMPTAMPMLGPPRGIPMGKKGTAKGLGVRGSFEDPWQAGAMWDMIMQMKGKGYAKGKQAVEQAHSSSSSAGSRGKLGSKLLLGKVVKPPPPRPPMGRSRPVLRQAAPAPLTWKTRISRAVAAVDPEAAESLAFTTEPEGGEWMASVSCDVFASVHVSESLQKSKPLAEESAAMVAFQAEFPDIYSKIPEHERKRGIGTHHVSWKEKRPAGELLDEPPAKRQSLNPMHTQPNPSGEANQLGYVHADSKSRLSQGMMILLGRSPSRAEMAYDVRHQGPDYFATVTVVLDGYAQQFTGEAGFDKKSAETNAAAAAMMNLEYLIEARRPEEEARRAAKKAERNARKEEEMRLSGALPDEPPVAVSMSNAVKFNPAPEKATKLKAGSPSGEANQAGYVHADSKSQLSQGMMILLEKSPSKQEMAYSLQQSGEQYFATVTVVFDGQAYEFAGEVGHDKKSAESNAAAAAMMELYGVIEERRPEAEARRAAKKTERIAKQAEDRRATAGLM